MCPMPQKFTPYNQMNQVYEDEEFQQQDSEPLVQQVDPDYDPTDKQVKQYARDVLGMKLPQDQRLLYLARQGLKAPLPTNWQPFSGTDGEVYYKHKITQQKTYQHPTDIEYRKKYIQEKERSARKNLKSMNLKNSSLAMGLGNNSLVGSLGQNNSIAGFGQPLVSTPLIGFGGKSSMVHPLGLSNISNQSFTGSKDISNFKLDPRIQQELQRQVSSLQAKLKVQLRQYQKQRQAQHQKTLKKFKQQFDKAIRQTNGQKSSQDYHRIIKQEKERIKQRLQQAYEDRFKDQFKQIQQQQERKCSEYQQIHQEDLKIKVKKYQTDQQNSYLGRIQRVEKEEKSHNEYKRNKAEERSAIILDLKSKLESQGNSEIQQATHQAFENQIAEIKSQNMKKIEELQLKLAHQFQETKRILGHDPNQAIQQMVTKKARLKKMSQQKLQSIKKKQFQQVNQKFMHQLETTLKDLSEKYDRQSNQQAQKQKAQQQRKLQNLKKKFQQQLRSANKKKIEQIYSNCQKSTSEYQNEMNYKLTEIRDKYIQQIYQKSDNKSHELDVKLSVKEKQQMIQNKQYLLESLRRQVYLQRLAHEQLLINRQLINAHDIDSTLKRKMKEMGLTFKPQAFLKHESIFNGFKSKYKADKQLLGSLMAQLQSSGTAMAPRFDGSNSTSLLVKQYNKDVRLMRDNQQMLSQYQLLLKKAELNDQDALQRLQTESFTYEQISLRKNLGSVGFESKLTEIENQEQNKNHWENKLHYSNTNNAANIEDTLKQHSKFLSTVKNELNRKLYKVRSNHLYRV